MRWHLWLCALCLTACAHRVRAQPAPFARAAGEAAAYSSQPTPGEMVGDAADKELSRALASACAQQRLARDGRLSELARAVARATQGAAPSPELVSFHARRLGISDPTPQLWLSSASHAGAAPKALAAAVARAASGERLTHCGGAAVRGGHGVVVAVALSRRLVTFERPIARHVEPGQSIALSATLAAGYDRASLALTAPNGNVQRITLGRGRAVRTNLRLPERGVVTLELLAEGPAGVTVLALCELFVGVAAPSSAPRAGGAPVEHDAEEVARGLAALIARERRQRGLPALSAHAALRGVALAHTQDMLNHHFIGHTSKQSGETRERVARAGLRPIVLLENIGRGYSAAEIHGGLMESPGHRANILNADVRVLGIGVGAEREGARQAFVATELFARMAAATDLRRAPRALFDLITARRKAHERAPLALDPALSRAAQAAADAFVADPKANQEAALARATKSVRALPAGAEVLGAALLQAEELTEVAQSQELLMPELVALGVGVAGQAAGAPRQLAIVLLLASHR